jgi:hypothetical protein
LLPIYRDAQFFAEFGGVEKALVGDAVFVNQPGDFHVVTAVLGDVQ